MGLKINGGQLIFYGNHDFCFKFASYPEITSLKLDNQRLQTSLQAGKLFVRGSYELALFYRRTNSDEGEEHEKREAREFGLVISITDNLRRKEVARLADELLWDSSFDLNFSSPKSPYLLFFCRVKLLVKVQHKIYLRQTEEVAGTKESKGSNSVEEEYQDLILKDKALRDRSRPVPSFYQGENHYYKMLLKQAEEVRFPGKKVHTTGRRMPRY